MGYDMHWRKPDPGEASAVDTARAIWSAAIDERNAIPASEKGQFNPERVKRENLDFDDHRAFDGRSDRYIAAYDKAHAAYEAMLNAEQSYFRLNMFGMSRYADMMSRFGMIFEDEPHPEWPEVEAFGITYDDVEHVESPEFFTDRPPLAGETVEKVRRYISERDRVLSWHGREVPGIPAHKFSSNDGWIVLPAEAEAAARIWGDYCKEHGAGTVLNEVREALGDTAYWLKWVAWITGSVKHDGFEVH